LEDKIKEVVKEIKVMKEERLGSETERVTGRRNNDGESVRNKILDKSRNRYKSLIDSEASEDRLSLREVEKVVNNG